ncbi:hypothetical protein [Niveibacterium sp. SC-1]|uniref:hypothetical protein n=1 Tax=Niveibacterium sp. SC-1 TaxID=3135646 RepID=UPI00311E0D55
MTNFDSPRTAARVAFDAAAASLNMDAEADPASPPIDWSPLKPGGANFQTARLDGTSQRLDVKMSRGMWLFGGLFAGLGGMAVVLGSSAAIRDGHALGALVFLLVGLVFCGLGVWLLSRPRLRFDKPLGMYFAGARPRPGGASTHEQQGRLADIRALQLLAERVSSDDGNYLSYELNLVLVDGRRVNVMDHGKRRAIELSARALSEFLDRPVWSSLDDPEAAQPIRRRPAR